MFSYLAYLVADSRLVQLRVLLRAFGPWGSPSAAVVWKILGPEFELPVQR